MRVGLVEREQPVLVGRELEEVVVLADELDVAAALRAGVVLVELLFGEVRLARDAVPALVGPGVDLAALVERAQQRLDPLFVTRLGGADEVVVGDVEHLPGLVELRGHAVGPLQRRDAVLGGRLFDLLTVLVEAGEEPDVVTAHAPVARQCVGCDGRVRGPEVGNRVHVVDRRGQIE